jgi:heme O synthase-like polyprenyltransferase
MNEIKNKDSVLKKYFNLNYLLIVLFIFFQLVLKKEYKGTVSIVFIAILFPLLILKLIKMNKEDKINNTDLFKKAIFQMILLATALIVVYFVFL